MSTTVGLQKDFFNWIPVLIGFGIIVVTPIILFIWRKWQKLKARLSGKTSGAKQNDNKTQENDKSTLKKVYLKQLKTLRDQVEKKQMVDRKAYQRLSVLVRAFVTDYEGVDVTTKTLEELKALNKPELSVLVERIENYYEPEFGTEAKATLDVITQMDEAKRMIKQWN